LLQKRVAHCLAVSLPASKQKKHSIQARFMYAWLELDMEE